ncbi:anaphase-promoting complex subunit cdc27 [Blomia tropicalis]|nr:anaphase-promoting complex subunit cdc27 [Blomia tropicalis]
MIIQEPIKATISFALENFAYSDAIFLCERLHAEVNSEESLYLLANAYYRDTKPNVSYILLTKGQGRLFRSPRCRFLLGKCCYDLKLYNEALLVLVEPLANGNDPKTHMANREEITSFYCEQSSFVAQLIGSIYVKLDFFNDAAHYFSLSLKINPFLWSSYEKLIQINPSSVETGKLLTVDNFEFRFSCGTNPLINLLNLNDVTNLIVNPDISQQASNTATLSDNTNTSHTAFQTPPQNMITILPFIQQQSQSFDRKFEISTPYAVLKQSNENVNKLDVITPETNGNWFMAGHLAPKKTNNTPAKMTHKNIALKSLNNNETVANQNVISCANSNSPHNNGITNKSKKMISRNLRNIFDSELSTPDSHRRSFGVLQLDEQILIEDMPANNRNHRNVTATTPATKKVYNRRNMEQDLQEMATVLPSVPRRSSRLYSNSNQNQWIKENTTSTKPNKISRTPIKRSRRTISFDKSGDQKEMNDIGKSNDKHNKAYTSIDLTKTGLKVQRSSAVGLLELMCKFGTAYKFLYEFKCKEAIAEFQKLPHRHANTGYVISSIGRAYFEMSKYDEAIMYFKECRKLEPHRLQGMEIYSTALWHQQREVELSCLARTLMDFDKTAPETWCVAGNCFSLQKEHEVSIKFLKRAIQVCPDFCYAYTLLGHELVSADELDNAKSCFRNATRIDPRHYNAWYGIGMIYYKQEKYENAYDNYKRALKIAPCNPLLLLNLGIVCHHMKKSDQALRLLDKALKLDPTNSLVKFHRASINFALEKYPIAMEELEELKKIVPKESMVYFVIGKIHKQNNDTHLALMNFTWAMELDPKGASTQIRELIDRHYGTDDEITIHSNNSQTPLEANMADSPYIRANVIAQAVETSVSAANVVHQSWPRGTLTPTSSGTSTPTNTNNIINAPTTSRRRMRPTMLDNIFSNDDGRLVIGDDESTDSSLHGSNDSNHESSQSDSEIGEASDLSDNGNGLDSGEHPNAFPIDINDEVDNTFEDSFL